MDKLNGCNEKCTSYEKAEETTFDNIGIGQCFYFKNKMYMKLKTCRIEHIEYNLALSFDSCEVIKMVDKDIVTPLRHEKTCKHFQLSLVTESLTLDAERAGMELVRYIKMLQCRNKGEVYS